MSSHRLTILSVVAAIAVTSAWSYWQRRDRNAEAGRLRVANAQLQRESGFRPPAAPFSAAGASATVEAVPAQRTAVDSAAAEDYRFQGQATPVDTLQTLAWALDRGDVELVTQLVTFDQAARPKVEAYRQSLPPEAQAQWPTVEVLAATLLTNRGINHPYPRTNLLARATVEPVTDVRVLVRLPGTPKDREVYQKVGDEWKWVITETLVDAYLANVARPTPAGR